MKLIEDIIVCPSCKGDLNSINNSKRCMKCNITYKKFDNIQSFIDQSSQSYEVKPDDWDNFAWEKIEEERGRNRMKKILKYINKKGLHLDVGTGRGDGTFEVSKIKTTIGIDYGLRSLRIASTKNPYIYQVDARHMPFRENSFDSVTLLDVIEHIPSPEKAIAEIYRVLKPGGILLLQTPSIETNRPKARIIKLYHKSSLVRRIDVVLNMFRNIPRSLNKASIGIQPYDKVLSKNDLINILENNNFIIKKHKLVNYYVPQIIIQYFAYSDLFICMKK